MGTGARCSPPATPWTSPSRATASSRSATATRRQPPVRRRSRRPVHARREPHAQLAGLPDQPERSVRGRLSATSGRARPSATRDLHQRPAGIHRRRRRPGRERQLRRRGHDRRRRSGRPATSRSPRSPTRPACSATGGSNCGARPRAPAPATIGTPGHRRLRQTISGTLEMSNVDLATEFTNMITAERGYQANSQGDHHRRPDAADRRAMTRASPRPSDRLRGRQSRDAAPCAQPADRRSDEEHTMITLHRLGHASSTFQLNPDLIFTVEANPDTVITLDHRGQDRRRGAARARGRRRPRLPRRHARRRAASAATQRARPAHRAKSALRVAPPAPGSVAASRLRASSAERLKFSARAGRSTRL